MFSKTTINGIVRTDTGIYVVSLTDTNTCAVFEMVHDHEEQMQYSRLKEFIELGIKEDEPSYIKPSNLDTMWVKQVYKVLPNIKDYVLTYADLQDLIMEIEFDEINID